MMLPADVAEASQVHDAAGRVERELGPISIWAAQNPSQKGGSRHRPADDFRRRRRLNQCVVLLVFVEDAPQVLGGIHCGIRGAEKSILTGGVSGIDSHAEAGRAGDPLAGHDDGLVE